MLTLADALSPSRSVIVATSRTRLSAVRLTGWSGPVSGVCCTARIWSRVTRPEPFTVTVNTSWLVVAVRPSTTPPFKTRFTASPVATSTRPDGPAVIASAYVVVPAPSAPYAPLNRPAKLADALVAKTVSSTVSTGSTALVARLIDGPSSKTRIRSPMATVADDESPSKSVSVTVALTRPVSVIGVLVSLSASALDPSVGWSNGTNCV